MKAEAAYINNDSEIYNSPGKIISSVDVSLLLFLYDILELLMEFAARRSYFLCYITIRFVLSSLLSFALVPDVSSDDLT